MALLFRGVLLLTECFSLNIGLIKYDKPQWERIVKTYLVNLAIKLPYLFHSLAQIQRFYQQLANQSQRRELNGTYVTFTADVAQQQFETDIQECIEHMPNAYLFVSPYNRKADRLMVLLVIDEDGYSITHKFHRLIHHVITPTSQTSVGYVSSYGRKTPEARFIEHLSKLDPF